MSQGQEYGICAFCAETRVNQRTGIERKAHGIFCAAIGCLNLVTAAASHRADKSFSEQGETKPVLIFKTVAFGRVESQVRLVLDVPGNGGNPVKPGCEQLISVKGAHFCHRIVKG